MRNADGDVAEGVVDVAARDHHAGVAQELVGHALVKRYLIQIPSSGAGPPDDGPGPLAAESPPQRASTASTFWTESIRAPIAIEQFYHNVAALRPLARQHAPCSTTINRRRPSASGTPLPLA